MYKLKVISLPKREDRRKKISHMFQHIDFEFCNGLDGETYKLTEFDKEFIKGNDYEKYGIHIPSLVCAQYTHLNLLDECSKQDLPFFIFEDDVAVLPCYTHQKFEKSIIHLQNHPFSKAFSNFSHNCPFGIKITYFSENLKIRVGFC